MSKATDKTLIGVNGMCESVGVPYCLKHTIKRNNDGERKKRRKKASQKEGEKKKSQSAKSFLIFAARA